MTAETGFYSAVADAILLVHFGFVAFVVLGLMFIWWGYFFRRGCVRNFYFRIAHLLAMAVVVAESIFGCVCPLTTWENKLRMLAGEGEYRGSFLQHWIHKVLFFDFEPATFTVVYCVFFAAIVLSVLMIPPRLPKSVRRRSNSKVPTTKDMKEHEEE